MEGQSADAQAQCPPSRASLLPIEYAYAYVTAFDDWVMALVDRDAIMAHFPTRHVRHRGPSRNVVGADVAVDQAQEPMEASVRLAPDAARYGDVEAHTAATAELAHRTLSVTVPRLLGAVTALQEAAGRSAETSPNPWDTYLAVLEQLDLQFDEAGRSLGGKVYTNSETAEHMRSVPMPPDFRERAAAIMARKREKWNAEKRRRRLPRQRQA